MAEDQIQNLRRDRLVAYVEGNGGITELMKRYGLERSVASLYSQHKGGYHFGEKAARKWEERLRLPKGYLDQAPSQPGVAHEVNLNPVSIPALLSWEAIQQMTRVPEKFALVLQDQAMAPKLPKGVEIHFAAATTAQIGQVVLVRAGGAYHVRQLKLRNDGLTAAAPVSDAWPAFIEFEVVAVASKVAFDIDVQMHG